jgi:putative transposase
MNIGYKTELKPNNKQISHFMGCCGLSRFAYNWGLGRRIKEYEETKKSSNAIEQHREINVLKKTDYGWMYNYSKAIPQEALRDLDVAFKNFFRRCKKGEKAGYPRFKSKKKGIGSFRLTGSISIEGDRVKLPRIGWVKLKEVNYLPVGQPQQVSISEKAGRWFISFNVKNDFSIPSVKDGEIVGIDLGINKLATCSDGSVYDNPKSLRKNLKKLKRVQQDLSRKQKGSKNREKAKKKVQRVHYKILNIRKDALHKATSAIVKTKPCIVVLEDLNVSGMMKNGKLSRSIQDASFYEFRRMMEYKLEWIGSKLLFVDRFYPSSKLCSGCGNKKVELGLSERVYKCEVCGLEIDRDYNASLNLKSVYSCSSTASSAGS